MLQELKFLRRIVYLIVIILILSTIPGCVEVNTSGDNSNSLEPSNHYGGMTVTPQEPASSPAPESASASSLVSDNKPAEWIQESQSPVDDSPTEIDYIPVPLTVKGDWAGYVYKEHHEPWEIGIEFVMLLRMQDEERGILGFCAVTDYNESRRMSDRGSGCAAVSVEFVDDSEILVKVDKWFYRNNHNGFEILPQDFSINLEYHRKPSFDDYDDYENSFYAMTPVPSITGSSLDAMAGVSESGQRFCFARISEEEDVFPAWYHQYDGLNGCLEGIFGFGECGADNVDTSNVFVFPLNDGSFRLRYLYTELGYPIVGDKGELGIPEYTIDHGVGELSRMRTEYWTCIWYPDKETKVAIASKRFKSFYRDRYIPSLVRAAQSKNWEDGFESVPYFDWPEDCRQDYLEIIMFKKLIFAAQEIIAGRFDGDPDKIYDFVEMRYRPGAVKLDHYSPENDPNAFILHADLDMDGKEETLVIRTYRWDGDKNMPPDSAQLIINGEVYFDLYGKTVQPKIFVVDVDKNDNKKEFAIVFTQENDYCFISLFRYDNRRVTELEDIWGKLDNEFDGIGRIAEFPGDGSIVTYVPGDVGFVRELVYPAEQPGMWIGSTYFY